MSVFDYLEDEVAELVSYSLDDYRYLSLFGFTKMRVPFKAVRGDSNVPGYGFQEDEKTGLYSAQIGQLGISLAGLPGALFLHELETSKIILRLKSKTKDGDLYHQNTQNRTWKLPDRSGIIALEESLQRVNNESFTIQRGQIVKLDVSGVKLSDSTDFFNQTIGLADTTTPTTEQVTVKTSGVLEMNNWSNVVGSSTLTEGAEYFVSNTAGRITTSPLDSSAYILQYVGVAISTTELLINIARPIIL